MATPKMQVRFIHENGKSYVVPATQVVVETLDGSPVSCTYVRGGMLVHSDASHRDWPDVAKQLGLDTKQVQFL